MDVFVWIYSIGNNLILEGVSEVELEPIKSHFRKVFDWFTDENRFPDGATFLPNTQYSPWDGCSGDSPETGAGIELELQQINDEVFLKVARERDDVIAVDQYPDFRGHGGWANDSRCFCRQDNTPWVFLDRIHPNDLAYAHIAEN